MGERSTGLTPVETGTRAQGRATFGRLAHAPSPTHRAGRTVPAP